MFLAELMQFDNIPSVALAILYSFTSSVTKNDIMYFVFTHMNFITFTREKYLDHCKQNTCNSQQEKLTELPGKKPKCF